MERKKNKELIYQALTSREEIMDRTHTQTNIS